MTTRLIQMDIVQLNIGSNPSTTAKHFCVISLTYTLTIVPSISFIIFTLLSKPPHYKASRAIGLDPDSRGLQCKYTKPRDERAHSHSRTGVPLHYTSSSICISISTVYKSFSICVFTLSE